MKLNPLVAAMQAAMRPMQQPQQIQTQQPPRMRVCRRGARIVPQDTQGRPQGVLVLERGRQYLVAEAAGRTIVYWKPTDHGGPDMWVTVDKGTFV